MLAALQNYLCNIYRVEPGHDVRDFLVTDPRLARMRDLARLLPCIRERIECLRTPHGASSRSVSHSWNDSPDALLLLATAVGALHPPC